MLATESVLVVPNGGTRKILPVQRPVPVASDWRESAFIIVKQYGLVPQDQWERNPDSRQGILIATFLSQCTLKLVYEPPVPRKERRVLVSYISTLGQWRSPQDTARPSVLTGLTGILMHKDNVVVH